MKLNSEEGVEKVKIEYEWRMEVRTKSRAEKQQDKK